MKPLLIGKAESMVRVKIITTKDSSEQTLKTLHRLGVLHVEESKELKPIDKAAIEQEQAEANKLLTFVNTVLSYVPPEEQLSLLEDVEVIYTRPFSEISAEVRALYEKINRLYERTVKLKEEVKHLADFKKYLEPLVDKPNLANFKLHDLNFTGDYLFSKVFVLPSQTYGALVDRLAASALQTVIENAGNESVLFVIARVTEQKAIESAVTVAGGRTLEIPGEDSSLKEFLVKTEREIAGSEEELTILQAEIKVKAKENLDRLLLMREALFAESERLAVLEKASEAKYVRLIEGWVPERDSGLVVSEIKENINNAFIDIKKPEVSEQPPVKLQNATPLKPFELVVKIFEMPKYRGWDPTPVVAYSFAFFFGLMVSDVIYGLGLLAATKFVLPSFTDDPNSAGFKQFQKLVYTCSIVAIIFGAIIGSYMGDVYTMFGIESMALVPPISQALGNPLSFVVIAILIGLVHVNFAHFLAFIKGIGDKNKGVVLNRIGLFGLQLGIPVALRSLLHVNIAALEPYYSALTYIMLGSVVLIVISNIFMNGPLGSFLWIFDISGLFGDVISYSRLAGVGLAGFYLGHSFNLIATLFPKIFPGPIGFIIGTVSGILLFIIGHTLNVVLGGMGGFVHSLRLCFVEFLTKFYEGGGTEYSPFKLRKRAVGLSQTRSQ